MKNKIAKITAEIVDINWFSNFGKELVGFNINIEKVNDINSFERAIKSESWEDITLKAKNDLCAYLDAKRVKQVGDYNKLVNEVKLNLGFVDELGVKFKDIYGINVLDDLKWIVLHCVVEQYFLKLNKHIPVFFSNIMSVYKAGNVPCGFDSKRRTILYY